jgi:hypothetical protein
MCFALLYLWGYYSTSSVFKIRHGVLNQWHPKKVPSHTIIMIKPWPHPLCRKDRRGCMNKLSIVHWTTGPCDCRSGNIHENINAAILSCVAFEALHWSLKYVYSDVLLMSMVHILQNTCCRSLKHVLNRAWTNPSQ